MTTQHINSDYLVIGTGIAGLISALELSQFGSVSLVTKKSLRLSNTQYAQGGIAAAMAKNDTPLEHLKDTLNAGGSLCNKDAAEILVNEGPARIRQLCDLGANFDQLNNQLDFTLEGAHSKARVLHHKDQTGKEIERVLGQHIQKRPQITLYENTPIISLTCIDGQCWGALGLQNQHPISFTAKASILATGGCGAVYAHSSNPSVATGDGIALAFEQGCEVADMEFMQFHPTTLAITTPKSQPQFLLSEALRGEGGRLEVNHKPLYIPHPNKDLAPRDIVAKAIYDSPDPVTLNLSNINAPINTRFPHIYKHCLKAGIDICKEPIPVTPAAHYMMGGIKSSINGETDISNLYVAGEVAHLGIHGANRLASNSLLEGLVFGYRSAHHAQSTCQATPPKIPTAPLTPSPLKDPIGPIKQQIQALMWKNVGMSRNKLGLTDAIIQLSSYDWLDNIQSQDPDVYELKHLWRVATLITQFSQARQESRGAHFRSDFPKKNSAYNQHFYMNIHQQTPAQKAPTNT